MHVAIKGFDYLHLALVSSTGPVGRLMESARIGSRQLRLLEQCLSDRDRAVLRSVAEHRFLLTSQLQRLHFAFHRSESAGIRACVRVLDRLRGLDVLTRLERRIGGRDSGSRGFVWTLTSAGNRLAHYDDTVLPARRHIFEPTVLFLEHTLAVAELRVQVEETARAGSVELLRVETEPTCWRDYTGQFGEPATLKPDLGLVTASGEFEDHWFIEVDRGTESIRTLLAKCAQYEAYRQTGREQAEHGVFPLVVWSVPDDKRRDRLRAELAAARDLDASLFRVVLHEDALPLVTDVSPSPDGVPTPPPASTHVTPRERRTP